MSDQVGNQNIGFLMTRLNYFCRLPNWTMNKLLTVHERHNGLFNFNIFSQISLSCKNKLLAEDELVYSTLA